MSVASDPNKFPDDENVNVVSEQTRALAGRLSGHMGLEAAIQISTENQWHGVLSVLLEMKKKRAGTPI